MLTAKQAALLSVLDVGVISELDVVTKRLDWPLNAVKKVAQSCAKKGLIAIMYVNVIEKFGCELKALTRLQ
jgi:hypothetical protein